EVARRHACMVGGASCGCPLSVTPRTRRRSRMAEYATRNARGENRDHALVNVREPSEPHAEPDHRFRRCGHDSREHLRPELSSTRMNRRAIVMIALIGDDSCDGRGCARIGGFELSELLFEMP